MPETARHPLERIRDRLDSNVCATPQGFGETLRDLAVCLDLPIRDYTASRALASAFIPPGWEMFLSGGESDWSCYLRKSEDLLVRGCGPSEDWAILVAALWALQLEDERGSDWRPEPAA
jgi:hypothetical protein